MKYIVRNLLKATMVIFCLNVAVAGVIAQPILENFSVSPEEAAPLSTITITAEISGDNISNVNLTVKECNWDAGICYSQQTVQMSEVGTGSYQAGLTLQEDRATFLEYYFDITINGVEERLSDESWLYNLTLDTNGNDHVNSDGNGTNGTPGFEVLSLLIAISIISILTRRKRSR